MRVDLQDLSFSYSRSDPRPIFERLNLKLLPGRSYALLGTSGSGKSTLLKLVGGVLEPTTGAILFDHTPPSIGYVPQESNLLPWLSVKRNIELGAALHGDVTAMASARSDLADAFGLTDTLARRPNTLSGGMKQRAALISALTSGAELLLLDEPFAGSDQNRRDHMFQALKLFMAASPAHLVVFTTHDVRDVFSLGATALWLGRPDASAPEFVVPEKDWDDAERAQLAGLLLKERGL